MFVLPFYNKRVYVYKYTSIKVGDGRVDSELNQLLLRDDDPVTDCCCGVAGRHRSTRYRDTAL